MLEDHRLRVDICGGEKKVCTSIINVNLNESICMYLNSIWLVLVNRSIRVFLFFSFKRVCGEWLSGLSCFVRR